MLVLGMAAQAASCVFLYGLPYLIPDLRHQLGLSLAGASTLVAAPLLGLIVALVAWGAAADRYGERLVITAGLAIAGTSLLAATQFSSAVSIGLLLVCAGVGGASVNARQRPAGARLVLGCRTRPGHGRPPDRPAARDHARGGQPARDRGPRRAVRRAWRVRRAVPAAAFSAPAAAAIGGSSPR